MNRRLMGPILTAAYTRAGSVRSQPHEPPSNYVPGLVLSIRHR